MPYKWTLRGTSEICAGHVIEILNDPVMDMRHRLGALYRKHRSSRTEIRARLIQLRRKIEPFNWIAPDSAGRVAIQVEPEMRAVDRAWPWPPPRQ